MIAHGKMLRKKIVIDFSMVLAVKIIIVSGAEKLNRESR